MKAVHDDPTLTARATRAFFASAKKEGALAPQPANYSGVEQHGDKHYVVLRNVNGVLAVFRVQNNGILKRLRRWPSVLETW